MHRSGFVEIFGNELTEVIGNEPNRKLFRATWEVADIIEKLGAFPWCQPKCFYQ